MPMRLRIFFSMAAFTASPFQLFNASITVIVKMSQWCSGSACMLGSSSGSSSSLYARSSSSLSYAVSKPLPHCCRWTPPSSLASLSSASCCTMVGDPADFSPADSSPADCPVADCSSIGFAAACSPVIYCSAIDSFPASSASPIGVVFTPTATGLTSRLPLAMLVAGATGDAPLLLSSPKAHTEVAPGRLATRGGAGGAGEGERGQTSSASASASSLTSARRGSVAVEVSVGGMTCVRADAGPCSDFHTFSDMV
ncbi:unnamed protein product [Closterium sp. NIES-54]